LAKANGKVSKEIVIHSIAIVQKLSFDCLRLNYFW